VEEKKNATKLKSVNKSIKDAKKEDKEIEAKKAASKKKVAEKRKAALELRKAVTTASAAAMASVTPPINLTE
jgi:CCR4-NOT transcriptional regulation complex NOT5 subunit